MAFIHRVRMFTEFQNHETQSRLTQHAHILISNMHYRAICIILEARREEKTAWRGEAI